MHCLYMQYVQYADVVHVSAPFLMIVRLKWNVNFTIQYNFFAILLQWFTIRLQFHQCIKNIEHANLWKGKRYRYEMPLYLRVNYKKN